MIVRRCLVVLSLALSATPHASADDHPTIRVLVLESGGFAIDGNRVDEGGLRRAIRAWRRRSPTVNALIAADSGAPYARVVRVMDILRAEGVTRISFEVARAAPAPRAG